MATRTIASWASELQYSTLPTPVIRAAVRSFYNLAGCTIGGSNHEATAIAHKTLAPFFGAPTSCILGSQSNTKTDAQHAALINGIASHVHDYDDTHLDTIIHPTGPVASALLAYAEYLSSQSKPVSGKDFILALVAGIEVECKCGLAVWPNHYDVGWHITSTVGSIGAAVAVGKLLKLDTTSMQHAIGIAGTQVTGLREMFGSHTKSFHPGRAAQNGLLAALMASNGYTSSETALEAKRGWANVVSTKVDLDGQAKTLGKVWEIEKNAFKPFPCGIVIHPIIDGCAQIHREHGLDVTKIKSVNCKVHPLVLELTGKRKPKDELQAKFSVFHGGALGLIYGKATPAQYEDAVVLDNKVIEVRDKIDAKADKDLLADQTVIVVEMQDGSKFEKKVEHAVGSLEVPITDEQLEEKFLDQSSHAVGQDKAKKASDACWKLESVSDMAQLASVL